MDLLLQKKQAQTQTNLQQQNKLKLSKQKQIIELFPIVPYQIQIDIANIIINKLNENSQRLLVLQSPTGTGKSYSLLVPIMSWLAQNRFSLSQNLNNNTSFSASQKSVVPSWLMKSKNTPKICLQKEHDQKLNQLISIDKAKTNNLTKRKTSKIQNQKKQGVNFQQIQIDNQEILDKKQSTKNISTFNAKLFEQQMIVQKKQVPVKLIFVSRTHSQLQQIMESIQKILQKHEHLHQKGKIPQNFEKKQFDINKLLSLQLGSKQQLCINPDMKVNNSMTGNNITQKCQYLLTHSHCPYFHQEKISQFMNKNLSQAKQISQKNGLCGYYSLRNIQESCDILCVPYATMLNESIRHKIGININNSIIVFDEGHNLLEYTKNSHSSQIVYDDLCMLSQRIQQYLQKYKEQMKQKNYNLILHFNTILRSLMTFMKKYHEQIGSRKNKSNNNNMYLQSNYVKMSVLDALIQIGLNQIRIHKIRQYVNLSNFDKKLAFFKTDNKSNQNESKKSNQKEKYQVNLNQNHIKLQFSYKNQSFSVSKIQNILFWIENLVIHDQNTKVVLVKCGQEKQNAFNLKDMNLKILCLQSQELQKIIQKSKMTIIAGGTMQPLDDFQPIFNKFKHGIYKFDHIITQSQCKIFISKKFQGKQIKFNHQNITNELEFLVKVIKTTINKIINKNKNFQFKTQKEKSEKQKQGIVVFIQNYRLIQILKQFLKNQNFFNLIVFDQSPKLKRQVEKNESEDNCFVTYKKKLESQNIAVLISVMGGKLSQGINFSDHLARKLIVFGLPYANINSPEIIQIMAYYDSLKIQKYKGRVYYQNMCIKSLNQTIGRAIRHKNDYADIYLIDIRFDNIKQKLSTWMRKRTIVINNLEEI